MEMIYQVNLASQFSSLLPWEEMLWCPLASTSSRCSSFPRTAASYGHSPLHCRCCYFLPARNTCKNSSFLQKHGSCIAAIISPIYSSMHGHWNKELNACSYILPAQYPVLVYFCRTDCWISGMAAPMMSILRLICSH